MAFLDSFKRKKETDVKEVKSISTSATDYIPESTQSEQVSLRSAADWLNSNTQEGKPFRWTTDPAPVGRAVRTPSHIPTMGEKVFEKSNGAVLYLKKALMTDHISVTYATNHAKTCYIDSTDAILIR